MSSPSFYVEGYKNYNSLRRMINNRGGCVTPQQLSAQHGWVPRAWVRKGQIVPAQRKLFHVRIMNWDRLEPSTQTAITITAWRWSTQTDPAK